MLQRSMGVVVRAVVCAAVSLASIVGAGVTGATAAGTRPPAPAADTERFGVYYWSTDKAGYDPGGGEDLLAWGTGLVASTGVRTIRVTLGGNDPYELGLGATDSLSTVAAHPAFARLFGDQRFDTYLLTTYGAADQASVWIDGYDAGEAAAERAEIADLGRYLLGTYPHKRFVLLNWEGDNAVSYAGGGDVAWAGFADWIATRGAGVRDAQADFSDGRDRLRSGVEFNLVDGCGAQKRCVVSHVAPYVDVDMFSYSSWESIGTDPGAGPHVVQRLDGALALIRQGNPAAGRSSMMIGEFGYARDYPTPGGECAAARAIYSIGSAVREWGVRYAIFWQIVDNPQDPTVTSWTNHGLFKYDLTKALGHTAFVDMLHGKPPFPARCPEINQGGVLDAVDWSTKISAGDFVAIFGRFSETGNTVRIQANGRRYTIGAGSPEWYQSTTQINVKLPDDISGSMIIYVRGGNDLDSNSQYITLTN